MVVSSFMHERTLKTVLFYKKTVSIQNHINRERRSRRSQFSYTDVMNNMNLQAVVTLPSIYHGCSTRKTFWEENFTLANMKNCGRCNFRKHMEIKNVKQYIALDISLNLVI